MEDLSHLRRSYEKSELQDKTLPQNPIDLFAEWLAEARKPGNEIEANAMTVATSGNDNFPKSRVVLLKGFDEKGFVFFTNYESEKGKAIAENPNVCLSFFWPSTERQVIIKGKASKTDNQTSAEYFNSRPRGSQLGAAASNQSQPVSSREKLDERLAALETQYAHQEIPKPDFWGGYVVAAQSIEFWQGRANRMHDRIRYFLTADQWSRERLQP